MLQKEKEEHKDRAERNYGYIDTLRKSMINQHDPSQKDTMSNIVKCQESNRDYFTASLRPIQHLIQTDQNPNLELAEPRWELYKVSISFQYICTFSCVSSIEF